MPQPQTECVVCADGYHDVVTQGQEFVKTLLEKVGCSAQTPFPEGLHTVICVHLVKSRPTQPALEV